MPSEYCMICSTEASMPSRMGTLKQHIGHSRGTWNWSPADPWFGQTLLWGKYWWEIHNISCRDLWIWLCVCKQCIGFRRPVIFIDMCLHYFRMRDGSQRGPCRCLCRRAWSWRATHQRRTSVSSYMKYRGSGWNVRARMEDAELLLNEAASWADNTTLPSVLFELSSTQVFVWEDWLFLRNWFLWLYVRIIQCTSFVLASSWEDWRGSAKSASGSKRYAES